jgi:D-alanine-D-alanine ligase-like ATP-grasp enzyme
MNPNAQHYYKSALKLLLPVRPLPEIDGFDVVLGKKRYFCRGVINFCNDNCSVSIARNKFSTNKLLEHAGLPVPKAIALNKIDFEGGRLEHYLHDLRFPLVIKPTNESRRGDDVLCNIQTMEELKTQLSSLFLKHEFISIEEFHGNLNSYRVLMFNKKVLDVVLRSPARVTGDGIHNLRELINLTNIQRQQTSTLLLPIVIDKELHIRLNELGLDLDYVPKQDESITLCYVSNASRGGTFESLGKKICKENKKILAQAAYVLNLNLVGFDVQCADINVPMKLSRGVIIEANSNPSIRIHEESLEGGVSVNVTKTILRSLIYRHPFSYLYSLYKNGRAMTYVRGIIAILLFGTAFIILR